VVAAFLVQQIVLWRYQSRWAAIKTAGAELEATQAKSNSSGRGMTSRCAP
jgi:hypothetical protein